MRSTWGYRFEMKSGMKGVVFFCSSVTLLTFLTRLEGRLLWGIEVHTANGSISSHCTQETGFDQILLYCSPTYYPTHQIILVRTLAVTCVRVQVTVYRSGQCRISMSS